MNDSHWIAQLHRFGLIRASFNCEQAFQRMRLPMTRHRTNLVLAVLKDLFTPDLTLET